MLFQKDKEISNIIKNNENNIMFHKNITKMYKDYNREDLSFLNKANFIKKISFNLPYTMLKKVFETKKDMSLAVTALENNNYTEEEVLKFINFITNKDEKQKIEMLNKIIDNGKIQLSSKVTKFYIKERGGRKELSKGKILSTQGDIQYLIEELSNDDFFDWKSYGPYQRNLITNPNIPFTHVKKLIDHTNPSLLIEYLGNVILSKKVLKYVSKTLGNNYRPNHLIANPKFTTKKAKELFGENWENFEDYFGINKIIDFSTFKGDIPYEFLYKNKEDIDFNSYFRESKNISKEELLKIVNDTDDIFLLTSLKMSILNLKLNFEDYFEVFESLYNQNEMCDDFVSRFIENSTTKVSEKDLFHVTEKYSVLNFDKLIEKNLKHLNLSKEYLTENIKKLKTIVRLEDILNYQLLPKNVLEDIIDFGFLDKQEKEFILSKQNINQKSYNKVMTINDNSEFDKLKEKEIRKLVLSNHYIYEESNEEMINNNYNVLRKFQSNCQKEIYYLHTNYLSIKEFNLENKNINKITSGLNQNLEINF